MIRIPGRHTICIPNIVRLHSNYEYRINGAMIDRAISANYTNGIRSFFKNRHDQGIRIEKLAIHGSVHTQQSGIPHTVDINHITSRVLVGR